RSCRSIAWTTVPPILRAAAAARGDLAAEPDVHRGHAGISAIAAVSPPGAVIAKEGMAAAAIASAIVATVSAIAATGLAIVAAIAAAVAAAAVAGIASAMPDLRGPWSKARSSSSTSR